jgi:hypothetical protein
MPVFANRHLDKRLFLYYHCLYKPSFANRPQGFLDLAITSAGVDIVGTVDHADNVGTFGRLLELHAFTFLLCC